MRGNSLVPFEDGLEGGNALRLLGGVTKKGHE